MLVAEAGGTAQRGREPRGAGPHEVQRSRAEALESTGAIPLQALVHAREVVEQDGQENVHHDERPYDDHHEEVERSARASSCPHAIHHSVPVLKCHHSKHGDAGPEQRVEVQARDRLGVAARGAHVQVGEELHADQREDVHEEHHQQREVPHLHGGFDHVGQQHLKILPVLGELEYAEEPQGPERREAAAPRPAGEIGHGQLHQRSHHNEPVKEVENVPRILFESKAHKRDHHFNNKNDSQPKVDVVQNIHNIIIFWVGVH
mmetsp:Transcript_58730/g.85923  ORF Transcript_58730/g.85923 Transcript_58730/m.85923 type:complete len:261 (-) Transcript_58730:1470-2252(-)